CIHLSAKTKMTALLDVTFDSGTHALEVLFIATRFRLPHRNQVIDYFWPILHQAIEHTDMSGIGVRVVLTKILITFFIQRDQNDFITKPVAEIETHTQIV